MYKQMMKIKIKTPKKLPSYLKKMYGREAIKTILDRTSQGVSSTGSSFAPYSNSYKNSSLFKALGKNPSKVDLRLFGDMLESLDFNLTLDGIEIFFREEEEAAKAHGHTFGANFLPVRQFFDLRPDEKAKLDTKYSNILSRLETEDTLDILNTQDESESSAGVFVEEFDDA